MSELAITLANQIGSATQHLIDLYTPWVYSHAISQLILGLISILIGIGVFAMGCRDEYRESLLSYIAMAFVIVLFGMVMCLSVVPDIYAPQAAAMKRILYDIGGLL